MKRFAPKFFSIFTALVMALGLLGHITQPVEALSPDLVISQIYGGAGCTGAGCSAYTNDYVVIFNRGSSSVNLTGYSVQYASAAGSFNAVIASLSGMLAPGQSYLIAAAYNANGVSPIPTANATGTTAMGAAAGKVALVLGTSALACGATGASPAPCSISQMNQIIDLVGYGTSATMYEGAGYAPAPSTATADFRAGLGCTETDNNNSDFSTAAPNPLNTSSPATPCAIPDTAPSVSSTTPANGAINVAQDSNVTVTFSEPVNVTTGWASLVCTATGTQSFSYSGGPTTFTIDPTIDFLPEETCTLTVYATEVTDQDTNDLPDAMAANYTGTFTVAAAADTAPSVSSISPSNGSTNVAVDANVVVNFSEPVTITSGGVDVSCSISGVHLVGATMSNGDATITLNPTVNFDYSETCTITVTASMVSDSDTNEPPDTMTADVTSTFTTMADPCAAAYTPIYTIQGSGDTVALTGSQTTKGVVVADYEGASPALRGFFIQDPTGDANSATSDGIFVFEGSNANTVSVGNLVLVTGTAGENQGQSQISVGIILNCGTGTIAPTDVTLPVADATFMERYEGMLVRFPQTLYVTEHYQLGRFGQVVLSSGDRLDQPTAVTTPGAAALALQAQNDLNRLILDDGSQTQNPDPIVFGRGSGPLTASNTLRGGDTITGVTGVMTYTWGGNSASPNSYRLRPINSLGGTWNFTAANPRPATPPSVGGTIRVVGMNLLNYFNTFDGLPDTVDNCNNGVGGAATDCRGADSATEFDRQWPKTISAIVAMDPAVAGIVEIENDGYGPASTIQDIVTKLNNATSVGKFAFLDVDTLTGQVNALGTDAIKVGLIYQPALVTPIGTTSVLNSVAFVNGGDGSIRSRPSLLQAFEENATGGIFLVDVNHLKSKGSACDAADAGDGQGNCNIVRTNAVNALIAWLATDPTGTGDPDIMILGDLNSYAREDPIAALEAAGFVNATSGSDVYSYVFDGQWGYLDYTLISSSLVSQSSSSEWHINADEPSVLDYNTDFKTTGLQTTLYAPDQYRISDHDPIITGLTLDGSGPTITLTDPPNGTTLVEVMIHELTVTFSEDVVHDGGEFAADNPANYMLVENGANNLFDTVTCNAGVQTDDVAFTINSVAYNPSTFTAVLSINNGAYLPEGDYRLFVCGTSSIRDLRGNILNGGLFDTFSSFSVRWPRNVADTASATALPATGFAPDRVTELPAQTVSYAELGDLWLEIPSLKVKTAIVGVPQTGDTWDVTWLGAQAGWLEGSAYPTALGNSVLTAHVWDAANKPGAFFALNKLGYGDRVIVHSYGKVFTYEVRRVLSVNPARVDAMMKHEEDAWLTLVTCQGYDAYKDAYAYRTLVRAVLVDVK